VLCFACHGSQHHCRNICCLPLLITPHWLVQDGGTMAWCPVRLAHTLAAPVATAGASAATITLQERLPGKTSLAVALLSGPMVVGALDMHPVCMSGTACTQWHAHTTYIYSLGAGVGTGAAGMSAWRRMRAPARSTAHAPVCRFVPQTRSSAHLLCPAAADAQNKHHVNGEGAPASIISVCQGDTTIGVPPCTRPDTRNMW
jgi:hypothetical protein